jgi:hypothetical protein
MAANLQQNMAAAPWFGFWLAYWLEQATGQRTTLRIDLSGDDGSGSILHRRRSAFLLTELHALSEGRVELTPWPHWQWPDQPVVNAPLVDRSNTAGKPASEHASEIAFTMSEPFRAEFGTRIEPIEKLQRQFPAGVFGGRVAKASRWTPGQASQVDLWTWAPEGRTLHLFELKKSGNQQLGLLPEALWYARLMHNVRRRQIAGRGDGLLKARAAQHIAMWLLVPEKDGHPELHPLIWHNGRSPLAWLAEGLARDSVKIGWASWARDNGGVTLRDVWSAGR